MRATKAQINDIIGLRSRVERKAIEEKNPRAMTFIEALIERGVFNALKEKLIAKGYSYKQLFWVTGILAFFISPITLSLL